MPTTLPLRISTPRGLRVAPALTPTGAVLMVAILLAAGGLLGWRLLGGPPPAMASCAVPEAACPQLGP